jgi:hypothetical protein
MSSQARPELRPFVRAYAQHVIEKNDPITGASEASLTLMGNLASEHVKVIVPETTRTV